MKQRIFVYGTLKRGGPYSRYMAGQDFIAEAKTGPGFYLADCGGYPGMFPVGSEGRSILGEVWDVNEKCLAALDVLEDVAGGEYKFGQIPLLAPFDAEVIHGYLHLRATEALPDAGTNWKV